MVPESKFKTLTTRIVYNKGLVSECTRGQVSLKVPSLNSLPSCHFFSREIDTPTKSFRSGTLRWLWLSKEFWISIPAQSNPLLYTILVVNGFEFQAGK